MATYHGVIKDIAVRHEISNKNSSGDQIANGNFYAVRPEGTQVR